MNGAGWSAQMNKPRGSKFGALPGTLSSNEPGGKLSRFRVPLQRTLADAELDVERAHMRLASPESRNVFGAPIVLGIVFALVGSAFALSAAVRAHLRDAAAVAPSATSERVAREPATGSADGTERASEVEVDVER